MPTWELTNLESLPCAEQSILLRSTSSKIYSICSSTAGVSRIRSYASSCRPYLASLQKPDLAQSLHSLSNARTTQEAWLPQGRKYLCTVLQEFSAEYQEPCRSRRHEENLVEFSRTRFRDIRPYPDPFIMFDKRSNCWGSERKLSFHRIHSHHKSQSLRA